VILSHKYSCHGPAIFADLIDPATGKPIIEGKKITGFTTQAEEEMGIMEGLRSWNEPLVDEHAKLLGAECKLLHVPDYDVGLR
jgi:putative intracellular protease/amidase